MTLCNKSRIPRVCPKCKFSKYRFVKTQRCKKIVLILNNSPAEICKTKTSGDIAIVGRYHGLRTTNIKHNLFHRNELGREVDLQNTDKHSSLQNSAWCNASDHTLYRVGLRSRELLNWFRDATFDPQVELLFDMSQQTDDSLHCRQWIQSSTLSSLTDWNS